MVLVRNPAPSAMSSLQYMCNQLLLLTTEEADPQGLTAAPKQISREVISLAGGICKIDVFDDHAGAISWAPELIKQCVRKHQGSMTALLSGRLFTICQASLQIVGERLLILSEAEAPIDIADLASNFQPYQHDHGGTLPRLKAHAGTRRSDKATTRFQARHNLNRLFAKSSVYGCSSSEASTMRYYLFAGPSAEDIRRNNMESGSPWEAMRYQSSEELIDWRRFNEEADKLKLATNATIKSAPELIEEDQASEPVPVIMREDPSLALSLASKVLCECSTGLQASRNRFSNPAYRGIYGVLDQNERDCRKELLNYCVLAVVALAQILSKHHGGRDVSVWAQVICGAVSSDITAWNASLPNQN